MVRLILEGVWIDIGDLDFEMKWKHPISNSLKGSNTVYSTDITVPLTQNNVQAFDYKIFTSSSKVGKYLYGNLYVNSTAMVVRCYVKSFKQDSIVFYLEQFLSGGVSRMLKDETNICDLYAKDIEYWNMRDVLMNMQNGAVYSPIYTENQIDTTPNIFAAVSTNYVDENGVTQSRPNIYADNRILQELADFYGITLNNAPENYYVYANQWKMKNSILVEFPTVEVNGNIVLPESQLQYNLFVNSSGVITAAAPFYFLLFLHDFWVANEVGTGSLDIYLTNEDSERFLLVSISMTQDVHIQDLAFASYFKAGVYHIETIWRSVNLHIPLFAMSVKGWMQVNYELNNESNIDDATDFGLAGWYPCWQNLPAVAAKELFETIAMCAGKMIQYNNDSIDFIDFSEVFGWQSAIDVSDKLISWSEKTFRYLEYDNATVVYKSGKVIAEVKINDETLPDETNAVATLNCIRIQEDIENERNKDSIVLQETTDSHFDVIDKLADIYSPLINTRMFQAEFLYFKDNQKPLLIRQLGGIFIALESIMTTKNTISLKLLKIK